MLIVGLTGGIASGKSTVARMLQERGAVLLDADIIAREVVEPGTEAWSEIVEWLGPAIAGPDGAIDRQRLGELVFSDPGVRQRLNAIVHPRVFATFHRCTEELRRRGDTAVLFYDVPLLLESQMDRLVDLVVVVYLPEEIQLSRLQSRDGLTKEAALARMRSQMPLEEKRARADVVIDNRGSLSETRRQVDQFWEELQTSFRS
ncbi:MAG: dephospho-CoA kinase [Firmicutes bacterium]|nr:dephospho-CoA kinase [Bacillota bacterium]